MVEIKMRLTFFLVEIKMCGQNSNEADFLWLELKCAVRIKMRLTFLLGLRLKWVVRIKVSGPN